MPDPPPPSWETAELKAIIDAEVAGLPDRLRAVVVLCLIEGRTNTEAASTLDVPVGTVDSRLNAARKKLQARLTRRGVAVGVGATLEQMIGGPVEAAGPRLLEIVSQTIPAILLEVARPGTGAVSPAVANLARSMTMTTNLRFLAALGVAFGLLGGAGAGIYLAAADDPVQPAASAAETQPAPEPGKKPPATAALNAEPKADGAGAGTTALLKPSARKFQRKG